MHATSRLNPTPDTPYEPRLTLPYLPVGYRVVGVVHIEQAAHSWQPILSDRLPGGELHASGRGHSGSAGAAARLAAAQHGVLRSHLVQPASTHAVPARHDVRLAPHSPQSSANSLRLHACQGGQLQRQPAPLSPPACLHERCRSWAAQRHPFCGVDSSQRQEAAQGRAKENELVDAAAQLERFRGHRGSVAGGRERLRGEPRMPDVLRPPGGGRREKAGASREAGGRGHSQGRRDKVPVAER